MKRTVKLKTMGGRRVFAMLDDSGNPAGQISRFQTQPGETQCVLISEASFRRILKKMEFMEGALESIANSTGDTSVAHVLQCVRRDGGSMTVSEDMIPS